MSAHNYEWLAKLFNDLRVTDILLTIFTGALALYTYCLWRSTDKLWEAGEKQIAVTKESADAAKKSAEIAEQALIAGQRAFVSVAFNHSAAKDIKTNQITHWTFTPVWINAGDTPTRNMTNHINIHLFDGEMPRDWDFPDLWSSQVRPEDRIPIPLGISPKNSVNGQSLSIPIDKIDDVIAGKKSLYMWGQAIYNDVFPETKKHITRFAVRILVGGNPRDASQISFSDSFLWTYNCSDEECERQGYPASWKPREMTIE